MSTVPELSLWIDGRHVKGVGTYAIRDVYSGDVIAQAAEADQKSVQAAVTSAERAFYMGPPLSPYRRYEISTRVADTLRRDREAFAKILVHESGMTIRDARAEVDRGVQDFLLSGEEAKRIGGEVLPIEATPGSENRFALTIRVPVGVIVAITPFNAPMSLTAHKIAPALAAGNTVVLKPAPNAPLTALKLAESLHDAGLPAGYLNVVTGSGSQVGEWLLEDPRPRLYTFTGSAKVGAHIKARTGLRRVVLELGNNSAVIVSDDADLTDAGPLFARAAFRKAGQVCVSVQRVYVARPRYDEFVGLVAEAARRLVVGDPMDDQTDVGPMISEEAAARAESWVQEAVRAGARLVVGGTRQGRLFPPTVVADAADDMKIVCEEIFAPVMAIMPFYTLEDAIERVNQSPCGLQAGVFTQDIDAAMYCARHLEVGGVNVNDTSNYRADMMPYGGIKGSGMGKEGPKYAISEMTECRVVTFNLKKR